MKHVTHSDPGGPYPNANTAHAYQLLRGNKFAVALAEHYPRLEDVTVVQKTLVFVFSEAPQLRTYTDIDWHLVARRLQEYAKPCPTTA